MNLLTFRFATLALFSFFSSHKAPAVKDYLTVPGPVAFNKGSFSLSWTSHPSAVYYKQEYLPATEKPESFTQMVILECVVGNMTLRDAVQTKVAEMVARKKNDPSVNYAVIENKSTGEYLLDFVVSGADGKGAVVEWNAYRYVTLKEKGGKKGILLVGYAKRAYGAGTTAFLKTLKTERTADINTLASFRIPEIKIAE